MRSQALNICKVICNLIYFGTYLLGHLLFLRCWKPQEKPHQLPINDTTCWVAQKLGCTLVCPVKPSNNESGNS